MPALLFGSISALADTSELQRAAFNEAFHQHGLSWDWQQDEYRELLTQQRRPRPDRRVRPRTRRGGRRDRRARDEVRDLPHQAERRSRVRPRPGVAESVAAARAAGWQVGLVTTTSPENVTGVLDALEGHLGRENFDVVVDASLVEQPKPAPDAYRYALDKLGVVRGGQRRGRGQRRRGAVPPRPPVSRASLSPTRTPCCTTSEPAPVSHHLDVRRPAGGGGRPVTTTPLTRLRRPRGRVPHRRLRAHRVLPEDRRRRLRSREPAAGRHLPPMGPLPVDRRRGGRRPVRLADHRLLRRARHHADPAADRVPRDGEELGHRRTHRRRVRRVRAVAQGAGAGRSAVG